MIFYTLTLSRKWLADNNGLVPSVAAGYENLESFDYTQRTKVDVRATVYIFVNCIFVNNKVLFVHCRRVDHFVAVSTMRVIG